jgi:hypothetical protein
MMLKHSDQNILGLLKQSSYKLLAYTLKLLNKETKANELNIHCKSWENKSKINLREKGVKTKS